MHGTPDLLTSIAICVIAAAVLGFISNKLKQPLILAYLVAGVVIGPEMGLHLVEDRESINVVSEIGLILLLFIIGLEIDLKKLFAAGRAVVITGVLQVPLCVLLGYAAFYLLGLRDGGGKFPLLYIAICMAISSTLVVVKLLYDKLELDTLPGRITLGVLVFQDIWAIVILAIQPNLMNLSVGPLAGALGKGLLLVAVSFGVSKYVLPALFRSVATAPEIVLVASLAWCFAVVSGAGAAGLSREMGALIAGISISTFPYNIDIVAKVASIRDFFVTLFFVALGMLIPFPTVNVLLLALAVSVVLVASRFLVIFPILHVLRLGHRASLLPSINLSQLSEFSIVIATLGLAYGHIDAGNVSALIFAFAFTSTASTYFIGYSSPIARGFGTTLKRLGVKDLDGRDSADDDQAGASAGVVVLGFYREASALIYEFEQQRCDLGRHPVLDSMLVIDFNPEVQQELKRRGIDSIYGDIAHMDTLHHARIHDADLVISTIPDAILKGTDNRRLLQQSRRLCPHACVVVTAERIGQALELYADGADFVHLPRQHSSRDLACAVESGLRHGFESVRAQHLAELEARDEILK